MEEINNIIASVLEIDAKDIDENLSKYNCCQWDSFNHIVLISELENQLNTSISIEQSEKIDTVKDIYEIFLNKEV